MSEERTYRPPTYGPRGILCVSGDGQMAGELCRVLQKRRFRAEATDGMAEALAKVSHRTPSLIIVDFHLADGSGVELVHRLRKMKYTVRVPIIMLATAFQAEHYRVQLGNEGPQDWIRKPIDENVFSRAVQQWIGVEVRDSQPRAGMGVEETNRVLGDEGTFADLPFARVVVLAGRRGNGRVLIKRHDQWLRIWLENKEIAGLASSYIDATSLGHLLVVHGRISRDTLAEAQPAIAEGKRLGQWLIENNQITENELLEHLHRQMTAKLENLFSWSWYDAKWAYEPATQPANIHVARHMGIRDIIFTGIARHYDRDRLEMIFAKRHRLRRPIIPTTPFVDELPVAARRVMRAADGRSVPGAVRTHAGMEVVRFYQVLYALWVLDLVRFGDPVEVDSSGRGFEGETFPASRETGSGRRR